MNQTHSTLVEAINFIAWERVREGVRERRDGKRECVVLFASSVNMPNTYELRMHGMHGTIWDKIPFVSSIHRNANKAYELNAILQWQKRQDKRVNATKHEI